MIVEQPTNPYDVAGWERAIEKLRANRETMAALDFDAQMASLQIGLAGAQEGPRDPTPGRRTIRETLRIKA